MTNGVADKKQNEVSFGFLKGSDLGEREQEVLEDAAARTGFVPDRLIGRSAWWGSSEIGAFHWAGKFEGKRAVLKIQGVRPSVSEIYMIESFARNNKSKVIRPPFLYASIPWDEQRHYEALILEHIDGPKIIQTPTTTPQVKHFFELYLDYRQNCRHSPWVEKYEDSLSAHIADQFERWRDTSSKIYPNHPFRKEEDSSLIDSAVELLIREYKEVEPEYMHGHFSENDLYQVGDKVVVLSNLYWSWRQPLYDAVFGYHWFIYHLNTVERITSKMIEEQRNIWLSKIKDLPEAQSEEGKKLLNLALLERAAAGLNLDGLSSDVNKPISSYLLESTRKNIKSLLDELNRQ